MPDRGTIKSNNKLHADTPKTYVFKRRKNLEKKNDDLDYRSNEDRDYRSTREKEASPGRITRPHTVYNRDEPVERISRNQSSYDSIEHRPVRPPVPQRQYYSSPPKTYQFRRIELCGSDDEGRIDNGRNSKSRPDRTEDRDNVFNLKSFNHEIDEQKKAQQELEQRRNDRR